MPSRGFPYTDKRQLMRDIKSSLVQLTHNQIKAIKSWVKTQKKLVMPSPKNCYKPIRKN
jgi:hypothetical protein